MKIPLLVIPVMLVTLLPACAQQEPDAAPMPASTSNPVAADCRRILASYHQLQMEGTAPGAASLQKSIATLTPEGNWPDIDYADKTVSGWKPLQHLERVFSLYLALRQPGTPFTGEAKTRDAATRSLHWWLLNKPKESQWYHSDISVPRGMRDIIILAGDDLTGPDRELAMKQLGQFKVAGTGANLVWSADLSLHDAALRNDGPRVAAMAQRLAEEIKVGSGEGIQSDWSFHQHGPRLQTFHYGGAFFAEAVRIAWQLRDTQWAWPQEKIDLLSGLALDGMRWQMRGNTTVPSTLDRSVTRKGALRANQQVHLRRLAQVDKKRAAALEAYAKAINANAPGVLGFRWFPRSDFAAYHTPTSSFFIKTLSSRTQLSESINQENLLGAQLNLGDHYIMRDGTEYFDLMGSWDWKQLPGVTWPVWADINWQGIAQREPFSGAATDGKSGVVVWEQSLQNKEKTREFSVRKSVFAHGNVIVSLWSNLKNSGEGPTEVRTTLDQSRLHGEVWGGTDKSEKISGTKEGLTWAHHNSTGYIALQPGTLNVSAGPRSGNWKAINAQYGAETVTNPTFTATINHALGQTQGGYVILLDVTPQQTRALAAKPNWRVMEQTDGAQVVRFRDGYGMAAFFAPRTSLQGWGADRACALLFNRSQIWASDPLQIGGPLNFSVTNEKKLTFDLPKNGASAALPAKDFFFEEDF